MFFTETGNSEKSGEANEFEAKRRNAEWFSASTKALDRYLYFASMVNLAIILVIVKMDEVIMVGVETNAVISQDFYALVLILDPTWT